MPLSSVEARLVGAFSGVRSRDLNATQVIDSAVATIADAQATYEDFGFYVLRAILAVGTQYAAAYVSLKAWRALQALDASEAMQAWKVKKTAEVKKAKKWKIALAVTGIAALYGTLLYFISNNESHQLFGLFHALSFFVVFQGFLAVCLDPIVDKVVIRTRRGAFLHAAILPQRSQIRRAFILLVASLVAAIGMMTSPSRISFAIAVSGFAYRTNRLGFNGKKPVTLRAIIAVNLLLLSSYVINYYMLITEVGAIPNDLMCFSEFFLVYTVSVSALVLRYEASRDEEGSSLQLSAVETAWNPVKSVETSEEEVECSAKKGWFKRFRGCKKSRCGSKGDRVGPFVALSGGLPKARAPLFNIVLAATFLVHLPTIVVHHPAFASFVDESELDACCAAVLKFVRLMPANALVGLVVPLLIVVASFVRKDGKELLRYSEAWSIKLEPASEEVQGTTKENEPLLTADMEKSAVPQ